MTTLLENPLTIISFGIVAEVVLGIILACTGRGALLWAMGGVLLAVAAGLALEWAVVTDAEQIEATLTDAATAVEANRPEEVLRLIAPSNAGTRNMISTVFRLVKFTQARVTDLKIRKIDYEVSPHTAEVDLIVRVSCDDLRGQIPYRNRVAKFAIELQRHDDRWLISGHTWKDAPQDVLGGELQ